MVIDSRLIELGAHFPHCPDVTPPIVPFEPSRQFGPHLPPGFDHPSPLELFRLFFDEDIMSKMVQWTNEKGRYRAETEDSFRWQHDTSRQELEAFFGLLLAMGLVRETDLKNYWSNDPLLGQTFFKETMSGRRFTSLSRSVKVCLCLGVETM